MKMWRYHCPRCGLTWWQEVYFTPETCVNCGKIVAEEPTQEERVIVMKARTLCE